MISNDQPLRGQMIRSMLDYVLQLPSLTDWESEFVNSIDAQFRTKNDLSSKQCEILERLYDKEK